MFFKAFLIFLFGESGRDLPLHRAHAVSAAQIIEQSRVDELAHQRGCEDCSQREHSSNHAILIQRDCGFCVFVL